MEHDPKSESVEQWAVRGVCERDESFRGMEGVIEWHACLVGVLTDELASGGMLRAPADWCQDSQDVRLPMNCG